MKVLVRGDSRPSFPAAPDRVDSVVAFHRSWPGYAPSPLVDAGAIAPSAGAAELWVKVETSRLGLPSFKILGASWAIACLLGDELGQTIRTFSDLQDAAGMSQVRGLCAATDGNHGCAVAHVARLVGLQALVFVPRDMVLARIAAIEAEGATVSVVDGTYDDAVRQAYAQRELGWLPVCDATSGVADPGPDYVIEGYSTIMRELSEQVQGVDPHRRPNLVMVQVGVGALAAAVCAEFGRRYCPSVPVVAVEPEHACCVLASAAAERIVTVPGPHESVMAGLNCGAPSSSAWPILASAIDVFVAIDDDHLPAALRLLAEIGISAGESGAAGLAALIEAHEGPGLGVWSSVLSLPHPPRPLIFVTEGVTDPVSYAALIGQAADPVT